MNTKNPEEYLQKALDIAVRYASKPFRKEPYILLIAYLPKEETQKYVTALEKKGWKVKNKILNLVIYAPNDWNPDTERNTK